MHKRLLMLAAAASFFIAIAPGSEVRAAAAKVPMLKAETSNIIEVHSRRHYDGGRHFHRHRFVHRDYHRHRGGWWHHRPRFHRHHHHYPRIVIYRGGYSYGSCAWLRHRAMVTGSRYWWRRYRWCRGW